MEEKRKEGKREETEGAALMGWNKREMEKGSERGKRK